MKNLENLKDKLCQELEDYARKQDMGAGDLEVIHKLTDTIKNIDKICMLEEGGEYSQAGYDGGNSYANRSRHWVRGHYSKEGQGGGYDGQYYSGRRDSRMRYSRDDGRSEMMEHLEMALDAANEQDREDIKRFMRKLESAT